MTTRLFVFGLGYSALGLARAVMAEGGTVAGTCQTEERRAQLAALGIAAHIFDRQRPLHDAGRILAGVTHLLISAPPDGQGDCVLDHHGADVARCAGLSWLGYLSTTGVYGDRGGGTVDESAERRPTSERNRRRVAAEDGWLKLWRDHGLPVHLFRLAGIYGPGRSVLDDIRAGQAKRIVKPGHAFSRIHVDDIVGVLRASMARPHPGAAYNLCDDEAAPPAEVTAFACQLLGVAPPPEQKYEDVAPAMSPMALTFWRDNRRVDNGRIKTELGYALRYPDYRTGLRAVLAAGG